MIRYTNYRKAALVEAAQKNAKARRRIMREHGISEEEMAAWKRDYGRHGAPGLRSTRVQTYRRLEER